MTDRPVVTVSISSTDPKYTPSAIAIVAAGLTWLDHTVRPGWTAQEPELLAGSVRDFRAAGGSFEIRRAIALGGQKGDSETLRVLLDNLVIAQTLSKDIRQKATDEARSYLYGRRHTPARAEAQDEGAAGEPVAKVVRKGFSTGSISWTKFGQDADLPDETLLYARPSPTPAADAPPSLVEFANMVARIRKDCETGGGISNDAALDQLEKVIGFARSIVGDPGYPDLDNLPDLEEPMPDPERHPDA